MSAEQSPKPAATTEDVERRVLRIIAAQKRLPEEQVTIDKSFAELGLDSLDSVNILFDLESEFGISIPDEQARSIKSVREMVDGVRTLIASKGQPAAD